MLSQLMTLKNDSLTKYVFYFGLFLLPFIMVPNYHPAYEVPKVIYMYFWVEILTLSFLLSKASFSLNSSQIKLIFLLFITIFSASFFGVNFYKSIIGNYYRLDGLLTFIHLVSLAIVSSAILKKDGLDKTLKIIYFPSLIVSIIVVAKTIINFFQFNSLNYVAGDFFGNSNFLAGYLLIASAFLINNSYIKSKNSKFGYFLIIFLALLSTRSVSAIVLFVFAILSATFSGVYKKSTINTFFISIVLFSVLFIASIIFTFNPAEPFESRLRIIQKSLLAVKEKPILGWGWSNFDYAFESVSWPIRFENDIYVDKAHSSLIEYLVTTGIFGFAIYALLSLNTIKILYNKKLTGTLVVFLLILIHSQTNIVSVTNEVFYWIVIGLTLSD